MFLTAPLTHAHARTREERRKHSQRLTTLTRERWERIATEDEGQSMNLPIEGRYQGWLKEHCGPWRRVYGAPTADLAWSTLLGVKPNSRHVDRFVLPAGMDLRKPRRQFSKAASRSE